MIESDGNLTMDTTDPTGLTLLAIRGVNLLGKPFGVNAFPRAFSNAAATDSHERSGAFDNIYVRQGWNSQESRSGVGSEITRAVGYRSRLEHCLVELGIKTIFDAPCGDLNWIDTLAKDHRWTYLGGDISTALVSDLRSRYPALDIRVYDICTDAFPQADLWHCRDCLFHLPLHDIRAALDRFVDSMIPYALLTTHKARLMHRNLDVPIGGFRYIDLERPPISLPRPMQYLKDYRRGLDFPRYVGLWRREQIVHALTGWTSEIAA